MLHDINAFAAATIKTLDSIQQHAVATDAGIKTRTLKGRERAQHHRQELATGVEKLKAV